ncbi:uncharacterized protein EDB93DRAFT_1105431 [Suillus bovinus]|uniref:uncharacterized protein n=1 Tax=Suillus bovinus TaxID=48563 RepID=UPI001B860F9A|nr:uncharacterized protein EDB93DRAFT_1105431 [Suillus bovinus]KAG2142759.1 hypothetical protein EDB93DRAFT_1105431 [Suillus bovinus]
MQTFKLNADSSEGSGTLQNVLDVVRQGASSQNRVIYRHQQLVEEKDKIVQSNDSHRVSSSAILRLPTELLAKIFLNCVPEDRQRTPAPNLAPVLLTTVCRRWREVAVDMTILWRSLRVEVGHGDWQKKAFCYDSYLKRSRGHQLSLILEIRGDYRAEVKSLLQPYVDQVSSLSVELFPGATSCPVVAADFSRLEELVMYMYLSGAVDTVAHSVAQLPPNIHSLKLVNVWLTFQELSDFNPLGWAGLTSLEIMVEGPHFFPCLLRLCPNLSSLTMIGTSTGAIERSETLKHTKLQTLRLYDLPFFETHADAARILGLFNVVTLPNLQMVEVRNTGQWSHEEFKALLVRSQCPLERLVFGRGVMTTERQRAEYATLYPSLKVVTKPRLFRI